VTVETGNQASGYLHLVKMTTTRCAIPSLGEGPRQDHVSHEHSRDSSPSARLGM